MNPNALSPDKSSKKLKMRRKIQANRYKLSRQSGFVGDVSGFYCLHCGHLVTTNPLHSGVQNRNHCPYCLFSQHLDLAWAGDRLSACKAEMQPVGLTVKLTRKKYKKTGFGELMVIHTCTACSKASINRVAADDDADIVFQVYQARDNLDDHLKIRLERDGITVLGDDDIEFVRAQLYGFPYGDRTNT
jgi:hypothetical protein